MCAHGFLGRVLDYLPRLIEGLPVAMLDLGHGETK
jgi:hypothetical protein